MATQRGCAANAASAAAVSASHVLASCGWTPAVDQTPEPRRSASASAALLFASDVPVMMTSRTCTRHAPVSLRRHSFRQVTRRAYPGSARTREDFLCVSLKCVVSCMQPALEPRHTRGARHHRCGRHNTACAHPCLRRCQQAAASHRIARPSQYAACANRLPSLPEHPEQDALQVVLRAPAALPGWQDKHTARPPKKRLSSACWQAAPTRHAPAAPPSQALRARLGDRVAAATTPHVPLMQCRVRRQTYARQEGRADVRRARHRAGPLHVRFHASVEAW